MRDWLHTSRGLAMRKEWAPFLASWDPQGQEGTEAGRFRDQ